MDDDQKPKGRARGAIALAEKLTPDERKLRAAKGAAARWKKPLVATHRGSFQQQLGLDVECYVLNDPAKTAVISQSGMARALGISPRGNVFGRFTSSQAMTEFVGAELVAKLENPLSFQWGSGGAEQPPSMVKGFDAALLIDLCNAITAANAAGKLSKRYEKIVQQAAIITGASAKSGIRYLVYALAGYSPSTEEVIAAFKLYVKEEARKYEQEFPPELYLAWHRLYQIPVPMRGKPWLFKELTLRHIYIPLAKSKGKILELLREAKGRDEDRRKKLFQFLSEVGTRALRMHIGRVTEMAESSKAKHEYESKIVERFGGQLQYELPLAIPDDPPADALSDLRDNSRDD